MADLGDVIMGMSDHQTDKDRPFTGQSHTVQGERGKTLIEGLRFRDLADCVCQAFIDACSCMIGDEDLASELRSRAEDGTLNYNDLFSLPSGDMDPVALIQNVCCRVEKFMGIFPNLPPAPDFDTMGPRDEGCMG